jgi:hypothetical protein
MNSSNRSKTLIQSAVHFHGVFQVFRSPGVRVWSQYAEHMALRLSRAEKTARGGQSSGQQDLVMLEDWPALACFGAAVGVALQFRGATKCRVYCRPSLGPPLSRSPPISAFSGFPSAAVSPSLLGIVWSAFCRSLSSTTQFAKRGTDRSDTCCHHCRFCYLLRDIFDLRPGLWDYPSCRCLGFFGCASL